MNIEVLKYELIASLRQMIQPYKNLFRESVLLYSMLFLVNVSYNIHGIFTEITDKIFYRATSTNKSEGGFPNF
ncbi:hypothetical protein RIR_e30521_A0A2I1FMV1_9GLOM [Rhizophagus irregularis DAOM 181602=DAOM 197198]|nr:hypothetical protein RhiirB3_456941 [Rhizophagus irregularis]GET53663.1 hypothetical protein RIR_e30521_A0A2I1FMV1_9GLOM [Rhizophagus irregularis DAOM 181602=DAOM 197198]